jgi:hypothetical protein
MSCNHRISVSLLLFTLALSISVQSETVDEFKARLANARPEDRPALCIQIAQHELRATDQAYNEGKVEQARASLSEIVTYSEKARDAAVDTRKHLKNVEIAIRKISERLSDIKRTLAFEDQPPVAEAIRRLEDIRTSLLSEMFRKEKK